MKESVENLNLLDRAVGWLVAIMAFLVYAICAETEVSFWDCGEFISASYLLQVPHPPGAPLYLLIARVFTMFAPSEAWVPFMVSLFSATSSALAVWFVFHIIRRVLANWTERLPSVAGAAIGALSFAFSDSFWSSATEAEVYNISVLFTSVVIWAALKFRDEVTGSKGRWILLIAFLVGCSSGVHLLSLLAIPAASLIMFYRLDRALWNLSIALISSVLTLAVYYLIVPSPLVLSEPLEQLLVNDFGLPFFSGVLVMYVGLMFICLTLSLILRKRIAWSLSLLSVFFLLLGSGSYTMAVLRSTAGTPMNEGQPDDAYALQDYFARLQYGQAPLLYGPHFNAPVLEKDGEKVYEDGKPDIFGYEGEGYLLVSENKGRERVFDPAYCTVFPRMWSTSPQAQRAYRKWGRIPEDYDGPPTFMQNFRYFIRYQIGQHFMRYVLWNFSGRQNNFQGEGGLIDGNWITGSDLFDDRRGVGRSSQILSDADPRTRVVLYGIPIILALIGMFIGFVRDDRSSMGVLMLFMVTGPGMVFFLNMAPFQARERDYAFLGAFLAISIFIGIGAGGLIQILKEKAAQVGAITTTILLLVCPTIMLAEGWFLHKKNGRSLVKEMAVNYLRSCPMDAILFTKGDNDTYPLWYAQQVEGHRQDVRVMNIGLLNTDWYQMQMTEAQFGSEPVNFGIDSKHFRGNRLLYLPYQKKESLTMQLSEFIDYVVSDEDSTKYGSDVKHDQLPTTEITHQIGSDTMSWNLGRSYLLKANLGMLGIINSEFPERPIAFCSSMGPSDHMGLGRYLRQNGMADLLTLKKSTSNEKGINIDDLQRDFDFFMHQCDLNGMGQDRSVYEEDAHRIAWSYRTAVLRTANALADTGKRAMASALLSRIEEEIPSTIFPFGDEAQDLIELYFRVNEPETAIQLSKDVLKRNLDRVEAVSNLREEVSYTVANELESFLESIERTMLLLKEHDRLDAIQEERARFGALGKEFLAF